MNQFYDVISELPADGVYFLLTGLNGKICGEKGIAENGKIIYETRSGCFARNTIDEICHSGQAGRMHSLAGDVYFERYGAASKMIICGGGHIGKEMVCLGKMLRFHVTLVEDRPSFADQARLAGADRVICDNFSTALQEILIDSNTYVLILTRGHRYDADCLKEILGKPYGYLGMIGSRARVKKMKADLVNQGYSEKELKEMHSPIGLSIGAATPQEIAISIAAQIIQVKHKNGQGGGFEKEIEDFLFRKESVKEEAVLATIISRKGSAPRDTGTKMIIMQSGKTLGTIGGGCTEADICRRARYLLANRKNGNEASICILEVDLTGRNTEEEGMVCGGILTICLEYLTPRS